MNYSKTGLPAMKKRKRRIPEKTAKKFKKMLDFSLIVGYNYIRRPERAAEQNLSDMRP